MPRVEVTDHLKNTMAPSSAKNVIKPLEEYHHYLAHRRELGDEERADIEKTIATRISWQHVCDLEEYVLDYQGFPLSVYKTFDDVPCAFLGGRDGVVVYLDDAKEGEILNRIDEELNKLTDDAIFRTEMFWFGLGLDVPDLASPEPMQPVRVDSFRRKAAEVNSGFISVLDDSDREACEEPEKTAYYIVNCLAHIGYYAIGSDNRDGKTTAFLQSKADSDLLEFMQYDPQIGLKMAAVYMGTLPVPMKLTTGSLAEFFDTGDGTVSWEGKLLALKTWGHANTRMPVSFGVAEFCCFDKMTCDATYGLWFTPRWMQNGSLWPNFDQEEEGAYERIKHQWDVMSEENYLFTPPETEQPEKDKAIPEWKLDKYRVQKKRAISQTD